VREFLSIVPPRVLRSARVGPGVSPRRFLPLLQFAGPSESSRARGITLLVRRFLPDLRRRGKPGSRPSRSFRASRTTRGRENADCILPWTSLCSRVWPGPNRLATRRPLSRAVPGGVRLSRGFSPLQRMRQREATYAGFASPGCAAPSGFLSLVTRSSSRSRAALFHAATLVGFSPSEVSPSGLPGTSLDAPAPRGVPSRAPTSPLAA